MPLGRILLYGATAAAIVMSVRGIFLERLPLAFPIVGALLYVTIVLLGVFILRLRVFTDAILSGPMHARGVVLTFDDGPDPLSTPRVLDLLDAARAKATFFVIGHKAEKHPELVRQIVERGHEVGVHSYDHDRLFSLRSERRVRADLTRAVKLLTTITGERPTLFRPPIGHTNPVIARAADELELTVVGWNVSARDGRKGASADVVLARVRKGLEDGAIVLMHDASEYGDYTPVSTEVLPRVLEAIAARQLDVVPLSAWIG